MSPRSPAVAIGRPYAYGLGIASADIVMTGGGALIRGLDVLLTQETGLPIHVDEDPLTCVVRGCGRILDDEEKYWSVLST